MMIHGIAAIGTMRRVIAASATIEYVAHSVYEAVSFNDGLCPSTLRNE
jgi:hypothetical protein